MGLLEDIVSGMYSEAGGVQYQPQRVSNGYDYGTGYYRFGGEDPNTAELLLTLAANELGLDNARRSWNAAQRGDWGEALKEGAFTLGNIGLTLGGGLGGAIKGAKLVRPALRSGRLGSAIGRRLLAPGRAAIAAGTAAGGRAKPIRAGLAATRAGLGATVKPTIAAAKRNPYQAAFAGYGAYGLGQAGSGTQASATMGQPSARFLGGAGAAQSADAARYQKLAERIKEQGYKAPGKTYGSSAEMGATSGGKANAEARKAAEALVAAGGGAGSPAGQAGVSMAALNQQYNKAIANLRSQYQLAETDQEKARLKFMLDDIEAQRTAGMEAISSLYSEKESRIRDRARLSREGTTSAVNALGQTLGTAASDMEQRMVGQQQGLAQDMRGLGVGAAAAPATNEWLDFTRAMIPVEQQYTQRMGDIGAEGIDWLGDVTGQQGAAQQADLARASAFARSGGIANYQREVSDRINAERAQLRDAEMSILMQQLSAQQSASELNARLAADRAGQGGAAATQQFISDVAGSGSLGVDDFAYLFAQQFGRMPTPQEESIYRNVYTQSSADVALRREMDRLEAQLAREEASGLPPVPGAE
jgi:hypothetical protein